MTIEMPPPADPAPGAEPFICPRTNNACPTAELCLLSNAPLANALERITTAPDTGPSAENPDYIGRVLVTELVDLGDSLQAEFTPRVDEAGVFICPSDVLGRDPPGSATIEQVAAGIGTLASGTVDKIIRQIQVNYLGRLRVSKGGKVKRRPD